MVMSVFQSGIHEAIGRSSAAISDLKTAVSAPPHGDFWARKALEQLETAVSEIRRALGEEE